MKIEYQEGCSYSMEIDDKQFVELTKEQQKEVCHKLIDIADISSLQRFIEMVCQDKGEMEDLGYCETCGEYNERYTINL